MTKNKIIKDLRHAIDYAKLAIGYYLKIPKLALVAQFSILHKKSDILFKTDDGHRTKQYGKIILTACKDLNSIRQIKRRRKILLSFWIMMENLKKFVRRQVRTQ